MTPTPHPDLQQVRQQLAPDGVLRAAINLSNSLLVSGEDPRQGWRGVAPDLAAAIADALGARLRLVAYATPAELADAADSGDWTVGLVGANPARARRIAFTEPYALIQAGYLVPPGSGLQRIEDVDQPGHRIAAYRGSAYGLWLEQNLRQARLVQGKDFAEAFALFRDQGLDALASLLVMLPRDRDVLPGSRILPGRFMTVEQAVGTPRANEAAAAFLRGFVRRAKDDGSIARWIELHRSTGLEVAPLER